MLTEKQLRRLHKAGVQVVIGKRSPVKSWVGVTEVTESDPRKVRVRIFPHKSCNDACSKMTLLHELIHARDALKTTLVFAEDGVCARNLAAQEEDTDREAALTYGRNPKIFDVIEELWGIKYVKIQKNG